MSALDKLKEYYNQRVGSSDSFKVFQSKRICADYGSCSQRSTVWSVRWRTEFWSYCFHFLSKHFKTAFAMLLAKAYLDKYDDAVILFYDSEFGAPKDTLIVSALTLIALFTHLSLILNNLNMM